MCCPLFSFLLPLVSCHKHCRTTGNLSFEMNSTQTIYTDTTGSSMFVNDTDVRMARTEIRGSLNLVYNLYEMDGWETKSDFSINRRQSLDPFLLATSRGCPVELPSPHVSSHIDVTKRTKQNNLQEGTGL